MKFLNVVLSALITLSAGEIVLKQAELKQKGSVGLDKFRDLGVLKEALIARSDDTGGWPCSKEMPK